ncbi:MAG: hypothetical protein K8L91_27835 [Anaerolineae bacterium]|nr:hypothetical protein [Anaerolineae bacterium]
MFNGKRFLQLCIRLLIVPFGSLAIFTFTLIVVSAQDDSQTHRFEASGATVTFDNSWTLVSSDDESATLIHGLIQVTLYDPLYVSSEVQLDDSGTLEDVLKEMRTALGTDSHTRFDATRLVEEVIPKVNRVIVTYLYTPDDDGMTGIFIALSFDDGSYGFADALMPLDNVDDDRETVLELIGTFNIASTEPCTVSTSQSNTVQLRVGPGTNRGVFTFLPANRLFKVLGQTVIDGKIWWKLDKNEVLPQGAAGELWVAAEDVTATPSCESVTPMLAPPPTIPPRPTSVSTSQSGSVFDPLCPGETTRQFVAVAWSSNDINVVRACVGNLQFFAGRAYDQQAARLASGQCSVQPTPEELDAYFASNWALADVATGYFILGLRYESIGQTGNARTAFNTVINNYSCAWAWDTRGWFWSLKIAAQEHVG